jgi:DNA-binding HxlR family transcriptional regulator
VRYAAGIFGDKWSFVLLRDVLFKGKRYYGDFLDSEEGVSTNVLADRLALLVNEDMLTRHVDTRRRNRVYYLPTPKARALLPALVGMMAWSADHDEQTEAPASFARSFREDPAGLVAWYEAQIDDVDAALGTGRSQ